MRLLFHKIRNTVKKILQFSFLLSLCFFIACSSGEKTPVINPPEPPIASNLKSIVIFYTNDEHGWMEATTDYSGAAGLFNLWKTKEGYNGADSILILSGGDMWTGPAISTWFEGESMVEVMNAMEYDAATIGNHEFDFKKNVLITRLGEMNFPALAANLVNKSDGKSVDFVEAYKIIEANGVKVGIIGLASEGTPYLTFPPNVEDFNFTSYKDAINKYAPIVKAAGAEVLIIIAHIGETEMDSIAVTAANNGISLICGGHTHQKVLKKLSGVQLIETNAEMRSYGKVVINYNTSTKVSTITSATIVENKNSNPDETIQAIIDKWKVKVDEDLAEVIGYCSEEIKSYSIEMRNLICDSWLFELPHADVSITNSGGIRQDLVLDDITLASIVGILPFSNTILELELNGAQLIDCLDNNIVGGMSTINGNKLANGDPINASTIYKVLTTDYLYYQENSKFAQYDPEPILTTITYAQPTINFIKSMNTSSANPIKNYLDYTARR